MAQLVQHLPRTQKIVGSSPARGSSSFSLEKKELSSGVVACICLVSITDYSCIYMYMYMQLCTRTCTTYTHCSTHMYMYMCVQLIHVYMYNVYSHKLKRCKITTCSAITITSVQQFLPTRPVQGLNGPHISDILAPWVDGVLRGLDAEKGTVFGGVGGALVVHDGRSAIADLYLLKRAIAAVAVCEGAGESHEVGLGGGDTL